MGDRILCFGDSNTYGYDPRSCLGGRYPEAVRWTGRLRAAGREVLNEGQNGRCIPRQAREAEALGRAVRGAAADIVTVMLGSNDLLQQSVPSAAACGKRMERFLSVLREEAPERCQILLVAPPPMRLGAWVSAPETLEESRRLAGCYQTLARRLGISFADAGGWGVELTFDGVHFSETGHRAFAEGLLDVLERPVE
ncbi:MAG: lipase [Oscillibacter sp.]|nr:lipase [Oscillibacter sp.]